MGMTEKDFTAPLHEVWEEHYAAVMLFQDNLTQWRSGPNGILGLDYTIFHRYFDKHGLSVEVEDEMMDMIRIMENHTLNRKS